VAYSDILNPEVLEPVIWKSLVAIEGQAAHLVPVDTGNLRDSLSWATNKRQASEGAATFLGGGPAEVTPPSGDYEGVLGTNAEYARAVEEGRSDMENYPAQPYLRPAVDWFRSKIGQISGKELKVQLAYYNIRHPYRGVEIRTDGKNVVTRTGRRK